MEEFEAAAKVFRLSGDNDRGQPGRYANIEGYSALGVDPDDAALFLISVSHYAVNNTQGGQGQGADYHCVMTALRRKVPWRPGRGFNSIEPRIYGLQTALVVGAAGEEIHTDEYARVRVQFHWDRQGSHDENSSAWVRVASTWAGSQFGAIAIPRVGQEVVVQWLDGNPDRPLITGSVYNQDNMPPWNLPANKTQSGMLSRSSKGGGYENANAFRFEDRKGEEEVWLHAEKNQRIEVENDESHWVGMTVSKNVDHDGYLKRQALPGPKRSTTTRPSRCTTTAASGSTTTEPSASGDSRTENVGQNETISIGYESQRRASP